MKLKKYLLSLSFVFTFLFTCYCNFVLTSPSFGTTHFIVGAKSEEVVKDQRSHSLECSLHISDHNEPIIQAFFTPDDDMRAILLDLIVCEKKAIRIAAFLVTDHVVAKALVDARARGVDVQIVTDQLCCKGKYGKAKVLHNGGIDVLVYRGKKRGAMSDLMHNKFIVFKENILGRSIVWTGSFNFTNSARLRNQENVLLIDKQSVVDRYLQQFDVLKSRCVWFQKDMFSKKIQKIAKNRRRKKTFKTKRGTR